MSPPSPIHLRVCPEMASYQQAVGLAEHFGARYIFGQVVVLLSCQNIIVLRINPPSILSLAFTDFCAKQRF